MRIKMHSIEALKFGDNSFLRQTTAGTKCSVRYINFSDKICRRSRKWHKGTLCSSCSHPKVWSHARLEMSVVVTELWIFYLKVFISSDLFLRYGSNTGVCA